VQSYALKHKRMSRRKLRLNDSFHRMVVVVVLSGVTRGLSQGGKLD